MSAPHAGQIAKIARSSPAAWSSTSPWGAHRRNEASPGYPDAFLQLAQVAAPLKKPASRPYIGTARGKVQRAGLIEDLRPIGPQVAQDTGSTDRD